MTPLFALCAALASDVATAQTAERAALLPVVAEGVDVPLDLGIALTAPRPALLIEASACVATDCPESELRGAGSFVRVRLRRLAGHVIVTAELLQRDGTVVVEATELTEDGSSSGLSAAARAAADRLAERAAVIRRRAIDADGDGVLNTVDTCPDVAGQPSARGCPDRDGDGVADDADRCPDEGGALETNGCRPVEPDPPPKAEGLEWGRVIGGGAGSFVGVTLGTAAGIGVVYLIRTTIAAQNPGITFTEAGSAGAYAAGAGLGSLVGALAPDVTCAGLCDYPLAASGWTRAASVSTAALIAAGGGAVGGIGLLRGDTQLALGGAVLLGAAPILAAAETSIGNCLSGPPGP